MMDWASFADGGVVGAVMVTGAAILIRARQPILEPEEYEYLAMHAQPNAIVRPEPASVAKPTEPSKRPVTQKDWAAIQRDNYRKMKEQDDGAL